MSVCVNGKSVNCNAQVKHKNTSRNFSALPSIDDCHVGPHPKSNWLIPNVLLAGAYPGSKKKQEHLDKIKAVLDAGVTTFVCLIDKKELKQFKPYKEDAKRLAGERQLQFLWAGIPVGGVADEKIARSAAENIIRKLKAGEVCYVHCWGGNGRTGTILSIVLARLYGIDPQKAIRHFQNSHAKRRVLVNQFPEAACQETQAKSLGREPQGEGQGAADDLPELVYPLTETTSAYANGMSMNHSANALGKYVSHRFLVLPSIDNCHVGPLSKSNWVIPGALLAGAYPGSQLKYEHLDKISSLLDAGVTTFVCLVEKTQLKRFNPYKEDAKRLAGNRRLQFFWADIPDLGVAKDKVARSAAETIIRKLKAGEICYVHCWGGNGRTGTILSIVLARLYGIDPQKAIQHFQASHAKRKLIVNTFPESYRQEEQAKLLGREAQGEGQGSADDLPELAYPL